MKTLLKLNEKNDTLILFFILLFIVIAIFCINAYAEKDMVKFENKVVAHVNGEKLTEKDLYESYLMYRGGIMDFLIQEKILDQGAKKLNISVSDEEVKNKVNELKSSFEDDEQFQNYLKTTHFTLEALETNIYRELLLNKMKDVLGKDIKVTNEEVKKEFDANKNQYVNIDIDYFILTNKDVYDKVYNDVIVNGFVNIDNYKEHIGEKGSKENINSSDIVFGEYVLDSKENDVFVKENETNYLFIFVKNKKDTYDELKDIIRNRLKSGLADIELNNYLEKLQNEAEVEFVN